MQSRHALLRVAFSAVAVSLIVSLLLPGCGGRTDTRATEGRDANAADMAQGKPVSRQAGETALERPADEASDTTTIVSSQKPASVLGTSVMNEARAAINRSLDWMIKNQKKSGAWSDEAYPALTALPLWAFANSKHPAKDEALNRAIAFIRTKVQQDGGIYHKIKGQEAGGLSNYNTAICMTALHATRRQDLVRIVQNARKFVAGSQHVGSDVYRGGFGYDRSTGRTYTDGVNSLITAEGMMLTSDVEDLRDKVEGRVDIDWKALQEYAERLQNPASSGENEQGGFIYSHHDIKGPKAGITTNKAGRVVFRSYGSMTYAGMLMLLYAKVPRDDPRIRSAFDWTTKHWSLEENPGMGAQGVFFFYSVLTKALSAYGQDAIVVQEGRRINWRNEVVKKLLSLHKIEPDGTGYWVNSTGRFWEANPVLATAYALQTLQIATGL